MFKNFIEDCLTEGVLLEEIDDYVEYWHSNNVNISLEEFLGMNDSEYEDWLIKGDDVIRDVLYCRRHDIDYDRYVRMNRDERIAARSYNLEEVKKYREDGK